MTLCEKVNPIEYIEGLITDPSLLAHIQGCRHCAALIRETEKLVDGMAGALNAARICRHEHHSMAFALGEPEAADGHLAGCADCRELFETLKEAFAAVPGEEASPLPPDVEKMVTDLRASVVKERTRKVLDLQGVRDIKRQNEILDEIRRKADADLPKAATPDDLTDDEEKKEGG